MTRFERSWDSLPCRCCRERDVPKNDKLTIFLQDGESEKKDELDERIAPLSAGSPVMLKVEEPSGKVEDVALAPTSEPAEMAHLLLPTDYQPTQEISPFNSNWAAQFRLGTGLIGASPLGPLGPLTFDRRATGSSGGLSFTRRIDPPAPGARKMQNEC